LLVAPLLGFTQGVEWSVPRTIHRRGVVRECPARDPMQGYPHLEIISVDSELFGQAKNVANILIEYRF
jgi:hypothetical protein